MAIPAGPGVAHTPNTIRLEDATDTIWLRPTAPSWNDPIVCKGHSLSSAAPRVVQQARAGRSGVDDLTEFHDEATFQAELIIRDTLGATRHQQVDRLRAMLRANNRPYLYMQRDGWSNERRAQVRGGSVTNPIDRASVSRLETSIQMVLPGGVWESTVQSSDVIRPAQTSGTGRTYPRSYPWAYTPGNSGATKIITTGGGEYGAVSTSLLMRLYGACADPVITNQTTGQVLELDNVTLAAGQYLEIDMGAKTVLFNGNPTLSFYGRVNFATSDWWELQPGPNALTVGAASLDGSCELSLFWTERFAI